MGGDHRGSSSDVGYSTGAFGKWHLRNVDGRLLNDQGFDEWYGIPRTIDESLSPSEPATAPRARSWSKSRRATRGQIAPRLLSTTSITVSLSMPRSPSARPTA